MRALPFIVMIIRFQGAMLFVGASKNSAINGQVADFIANLADMNGKGGSEVNLLTDVTTFEEREVRDVHLSYDKIHF